MSQKEFHYDENRNLIDWPKPPITTDCNGVELKHWDTIVAIKWLAVKWWTDIKKWDIYKNIVCTDDPTHVRATCKKNWKIFLKTEFFKKVW